MSNGKSIKVRQQQKIDTSENWAKAKNFIPLAGELIVYSDLNQIKVGNGIQKVSELSFIKASNITSKDDDQGNVTLGANGSLLSSDDGLGNVSII